MGTIIIQWAALEIYLCQEEYSLLGQTLQPDGGFQ